MLSFSYGLSDGSERPLHAVTEAVHECSLDVPADSLRVCVKYDCGVRAHARSLIMRDGCDIIFRGGIDRIVLTNGSGGSVLRLYARSAAGLLLDNEAEPLVYTNPSAELIARRYLQPFGIRAEGTAKGVLYGHFRIDKGMSQWQALERFCRAMYGKSPRISGDGTAYLDGLPRGETVTFGEGGIPCYSLEERQNPCRLLSKVWLKLSPKDGYISALNNPNAACGGIRRERYVDATAQNRSIDTAQKMIDNSNAASYSVILRCGGCQAPLLGRAAQVLQSEIGTLDGLLITGVKTRLDRSGAISAITLEKEKY